MKTAIREVDDQTLADWLSEHQQPAFRARQIREWVDARLVVSFDEMKNLPKTLREELAEAFDCCALHPINTLRAEDGTVKWLSELGDRTAVETVLIRSPKRSTVCISTQVGCAVRCAFCESGRHGLVRNLRPAEIYDQVALASHEAGKLVDNVVVMGTGEPMHNLDNLLPALDKLCDPDHGFGMSARHITISTSGIPAGIRRLADQQRPWNLALSLHAPSDTLRALIIPDRHRHRIAEILDACSYYRAHTGRMVTFEYVLVDGLNATKSCARDLADIARDAHVKVNLIPLNPGAVRWKAPSPEACEQFLHILELRGVQATLRRRKGDKIQAACGQLKPKPAPENLSS